MVVILLLLVLVGGWVTVDGANTYAELINGAEVININTNGAALAYATNLQIDVNDTNDPMTLYFTADKGVPNLFTAQFSKNGKTPDTFWSSGVSPAPNSSPFISFDVVGRNIIGPSYPSTSGSATFSIQTIFLDSIPIVNEKTFPGFQFYSVIIDPRTNTQGRSYVYLAGWAAEQTGTSDPFVLGRATVTLQSPFPDFQLDISNNNDILPLPLVTPCFDRYDEVLRPSMNLINNTLMVLIPGRCGLIASVELPNPNSITPTPFSQVPLSSIKFFNPLQNQSSDSVYVSSAVFDNDHSVAYFIIKTFDYAHSVLHSFSLDSWTLNTPSLNLADDFTESEPIVVLGTEYSANGTPIKYLFIVGSGADYIERLEVTADFHFNAKTLAYLTSSISQISAAYFIRPYIYFVTNEPDAKIIRVSKTSFCGDPCGDFAYCNMGVCTCINGYLRDNTDPKRPCKLAALVTIQTAVIQSEGAAAALGVLLSFSIVASLAGWILWCKNRPN